MTDSLNDVPPKVLAYHWFVQGFSASREGFNAEATYNHLNPDENPHSIDQELSHENRELLRTLFEKQWNADND